MFIECCSRLYWFSKLVAGEFSSITIISWALSNLLDFQYWVWFPSCLRSGGLFSSPHIQFGMFIGVVLVLFAFGQPCWWDFIGLASDVPRKYKFPVPLALTIFQPPLLQCSLSLRYGMLVDVSKGTGLYTILQFDDCDFLHMPDWTGKSMRPQPYTKNCRQLRNVRSGRGGLPRTSTSIGCSVPTALKT